MLFRISCLVILLRSIFGGSIYMIFLAIGLVNWVNIARLVRGQILSLKSRDFVTAARAFGGIGPLPDSPAPDPQFIRPGDCLGHFQYSPRHLYRSGFELYRHRGQPTNTKLGRDDP